LLLCFVDADHVSASVHDTRLEQQSGHLIGDGRHPAHVFLAMAAFTLESTIAIISVADTVVTGA
jgi:hypothetical protein